MSGTLYGMVTLKVTNNYADKAVDSFTKNTTLKDGDIFIMIDNDGDYKQNWNRGRIDESDIIIHDQVKNFSYNMNVLVEIALSEKKDLVFLSNDVLFTPNWSELLVIDDNTVTLPSCNQTHRVGIPSIFSLEQFGEQYKALNAIAKSVNEKNYYFESMLMPGYVCRMPLKILESVGGYDDTFIHGAEDVDYRLRCIQKGFDMKYTPSFLLHFNGRSSWNGVETPKQINTRNEKYINRFIEKWGIDLRNLCLILGNQQKVITKYNLKELYNQGKYNELLRTLFKQLNLT